MDPGVTASDGAATLRTRADGATELRVNGVFVMDDRETSSERLLARRAVDSVPGPGRVLVGGLGLGYTVRELLTDPRVEHVLVAEVEPAIVTWMRDGVLPGAELLADPRVTIRVAAVQDVIAQTAPGSLDVILLDVDNGPDFLVYEANAAVYEPAFLRRCAELLTPHGELCIWSQSDAAAVRGSLETIFDQVAAEHVPVRLQQREETYWLLRGAHPRRAGTRADNLDP